MKSRWIIGSMLILGVLLLGLALVMPAQAVQLTDKEQLGKDLFFDENLSLNKNQACAACHGPDVGYTGPSTFFNAAGGVYEGSIPGAFGDRKPPTAAYAGDSPNLHQEDGAWVGGMFWDGRATGDRLGDPLAEQAQGPFLNPKEQAIPTEAALCQKVAASGYAELFEQVWGTGSLDCTDNVEAVYIAIGRSIAAYERSSEVSSYTSKFDSFWTRANAKGLDVTEIDMKNWNKYKALGFSNDELKGLALFNTKGGCSACHTLEAGPAGFPLFTDFTYDNLGLPKNLENPMTIANPDWADPGLGGALQKAGYPEATYSTEIGKFKVPTLRNVDLRPTSTTIKAYGHNAYFKSLKEIVHFYNTRDVVKKWPAPETSANMNKTEIGNLGLSDKEEALIVTFMQTLSDGWMK